MTTNQNKPRFLKTLASGVFAVVLSFALSSYTSEAGCPNQCVNVSAAIERMDNAQDCQHNKRCKRLRKECKLNKQAACFGNNCKDKECRENNCDDCECNEAKCKANCCGNACQNEECEDDDCEDCKCK